MILTRDNLLRFVREKKYVTPSTVSEPFETSTMIASAALGELTKDKLLSVTHFKLGSSPYYYDPRQKEALIEIAEKHFSKLDKDIFLKLQQNQILNDKSLSVQERLAIARIKDFAIPLEISYNGLDLNFWVWYLRNLNETKNQIIEALSSQDKTYEQKQNKQEEIKNQVEKEVKKDEPIKIQQQILKQEREDVFNKFEDEVKNNNFKNGSNQNEQKKISNEHISFNKNQEEIFIEKYLDENYLNIENKQKSDNGISFTCILKVHKLNILIDCFYFYKKPNEGDIIKFYTSSMRPKIAFIINCPKKLYKLAESCDNFEVVNI